MNSSRVITFFFIMVINFNRNHFLRFIEYRDKKNQKELPLRGKNIFPKIPDMIDSRIDNVLPDRYNLLLEYY